MRDARTKRRFQELVNERDHLFLLSGVARGRARPPTGKVLVVLAVLGPSTTLPVE